MTEASDALVISSAAASTGIIVYGIVISAIQVIGAGTAIAVLSGLARFWYDRKEDKRRKVRERIQQLLPEVYDPIFRWAATTKKSLDERKLDDEVRGFSGPPDFSDKAVYYALVGQKLRNEFKEIRALHNSYLETLDNLKSDYDTRLQSKIGDLNPEWKYDGVFFRASTGGQLGVKEMMRSYPISTITYMLRQGASAFIGPTSGPWHPCRPHMIDALCRLEGLPSYEKCMASRTVLVEKLEAFLKTLTMVVETGESDWRF